MDRLKHYSVPHLVHIETTYSCNARCSFCYNPLRETKINYDTVDRIVDSIHKSEIPHVYLIGGEPSLLSVAKLNEYIEKLSGTSSVTIVTNGLKYLDGLSDKLACIGVPIHGNKETHEKLTGVKGGYDKVLDSINKYVSAGFDVRCIPVLMSVNYDQMYDIIKLAHELGMESVFVDRFESGGLGSKQTELLKPTLEQFKESLTQMIRARDDFGIKVGFGTAIPYCLDKRLISENLAADCGVGVTFGAVSPNGDFRICNQSPRVYGNVLKEPVEDIWNKKELDEYRNLGWVDEPCKSCTLLQDCVGGCKVDLTCTDGFCIDYAIRGKKEPVTKIDKLPPENPPVSTYPNKYRTFRLNKYTKLNTRHKENYIVTRYQTVEIDDAGLEIMKKIVQSNIHEEEDLARELKDSFDEKDVRIFVSRLFQINAIDLK